MLEILKTIEPDIPGIESQKKWRYDGEIMALINQDLGIVIGMHQTLPLRGLYWIRFFDGRSMDPYSENQAHRS